MVSKIDDGDLSVHATETVLLSYSLRSGLLRDFEQWSRFVEPTVRKVECCCPEMSLEMKRVRF